MPEGLLEDVKNYLDLTWPDNRIDDKVTGIARRGMAYLDGVAGTSLDYTVETAPRELLLEYCRYSINGILDQFENNYAPFLVRLAISYGTLYGGGVN